MRGRRPELQAIEGGLSSVPPTPAHLSAMRDSWDVIAADLLARRLLTASMLTTLEAFLTASWMVSECQKRLAIDGLTIKTKNDQPRCHPLVGALNKSLEQVARLAAELGLTPAARSRKGLQLPKGQGSDDPFSDMDL